jgi:hypothetical protein
MGECRFQSALGAALACAYAVRAEARMARTEALQRRSARGSRGSPLARLFLAPQKKTSVFIFFSKRGFRLAATLCQNLGQAEGRDQ